MRRAPCASVVLAVGLAGTACKHKPPASAARDLTVVEVARFVRSDVTDKRGWAADVRLALKRAERPVDADHVCQVLAIVEQESGYEADPSVPGLGKVVKGELDRLFAKLGPAAAPARSALLDHVGAGATTTFEQRLSAIRTEQDADVLYREIVDYHRARHPTLSRAMDLLAPDLVEAANPITTAGSMQVSVAWALEAAGDDGAAHVRDALYTRSGGLLYGTMRLFVHEADYDQPRYRFADYNAGVYASRNAALQAQLSAVTGRALALDGDFLLYDKDGDPRWKRSNSLDALYAFRDAHAPTWTDGQVRRDAKKEKSAAFDATVTVETLRSVYAAEKGRRPVYAQVPDVALESPKMKAGRSTKWFADSVQRRYDDCLGRPGRARRRKSQGGAGPR